MFSVILAHGLFGFTEMVGIEYFRGVKKFLKRKFTDMNVIATEVAPNDFVEERASQLWDQIERLDEKVHIIAHSMGGLDARFMISPGGLNKAEKVASLTTISTPHWGSPIADLIIEKSERFSSKDIERIIQKVPFVNMELRRIIKKLKETDKVWSYILELFRFSEKGVTNLTTSYLRQFNYKCKDAENVKYFSYAGVSGPGEKDNLPLIFYLSWAIVFLNDDERTGGRNDGIVSINSAKWGDFKGEVPADHYQQVGWDLTGLEWLKKVFPCMRSFNHLKFFEKIIVDLKNL